MPPGNGAVIVDRSTAAARSTGRGGRWVPWIGTGLLFSLLFTLALARARALDASYDVGYFAQAAWLVTHGEPVFVTVRGLYLFGDHASPVFWPIAWLTAVAPRIPTLLAVQSLALALGIVPLYAICRQLGRLRTLPTVAVLIAYALYPALHNVNLADFHPEAVAVPALLGAAYFGLVGRWLPYAACLGVVLLSREDLCVTAAFLGLLLVWEGRRRAGLVTVAVAVVWLAVDLTLILPHYAGGFVQAGVLGRYGGSSGEIVGYMVTHPWQVVFDLGTAENARYVWLVLAPVVFLPLVAPRYLMPAVPLQLLYLVSSRPAAHTIEGQYTVSAIAFVFLATAMALGRVREGGPDRTALVPLIAAAFFFNTSWSAGGLQAHPWEWHRSATDRAMAAAARRIPRSAAVSASVPTWQVLAERRDLYEFPGPWEQYAGLRRHDPIPLVRRERETRWILVNTADPLQWSRARSRSLDRLVRLHGFHEVFDRAGVRLYRR